MRTLGAFIAAIGAGALLCGIGFSIDAYANYRDLHSCVTVFLIGATLGLIVGVPTAAIGGVPIWLLLRWFRIESASAYVSAGAALALITQVLVMATWPTEPWRWYVPYCVIAIFAGSSGGCVFWMIAMRAFLKTDENR